MYALPDWSIWVLAVAVTALLVWFFVQVVLGFFRGTTALARLPRSWRAVMDAERMTRVRVPRWKRIARVVLVAAMIVLLGIALWRKFFGIA